MMLQGWVVIAIALGYIGLLFVVASYGDRLRAYARGDRSRLLLEIVHATGPSAQDSPRARTPAKGEGGATTGLLLLLLPTAAATSCSLPAASACRRDPLPPACCRTAGCRALSLLPCLPTGRCGGAIGGYRR